jgi:drug/metabolite transporter (DMT)-like permease
MTWIFLSLLSAMLLGLYDIAKKSAVDANAVAPVLLLNVITGAACCIPLVIASRFASNEGSQSWLRGSIWYVEPIATYEHLLVSLKSLLVGLSWMLSFVALRSLPISIASPIRATSPVWTVLIAVLWMGERPEPMQWFGMSVVFVAFVAFTRVGKSEGIHFHRDRGVGLLVAATLLGSCSALYDKYLLQSVGISPATLQAWFAIYLVPVMIPWFLWWYLSERKISPFSWRWSIPLIALFLLAADFCYFSAISHPEALISVISPLRRASIIIAFLAGILWLGEKNWKRKSLCIGVLLFGVCLMSWGRSG